MGRGEGAATPSGVRKEGQTLGGGEKKKERKPRPPVSQASQAESVAARPGRLITELI